MQKKYAFISSDVQRQLNGIKRLIYLKMNGITADSMANNGIRYAKNYGVSLPEIKLMAQAIVPDHALAQLLWQEKIRETMLLATYIQPADSFDEALSELWLIDIQNLELAEQISRNLFARLPFMPDKVSEWSGSDNVWCCSVGFFTAAFGCNRLSAETKAFLQNVALTTLVRDELPVYRAIALFLRKKGAENRAEAVSVLQAIASFASSSKLAENYIFEEVSTDLKYKFNLS